MPPPPPPPPTPTLSRPIENLMGDMHLQFVPRVPGSTMGVGHSIPALKKNRFLVLAKIAVGGMGVVYFGYDYELKMEVAIKVLSPFHMGVLAEKNRVDFLVQRNESVCRLSTEARAAFRVTSPHVVQVRLVDDEPPCNEGPCGLWYIVMEYVHGESAERLCDRIGYCLPEDLALDICIAVARGLRDLHKQGIVHRDIKHGNILLPWDDEQNVEADFARISDLGLAREPHGLRLTESNIGMGTLIYMSPEQYLNAKSAPFSADCWSLGVTLYMFLSGVPPFGSEPRDHRTQYDMIANTRHKPLGAPVSSATVALVNQCLEKDPARRPADGRVLLKQLLVCRIELRAKQHADKMAAVHAHLLQRTLAAERRVNALVQAIQEQGHPPVVSASPAASRRMPAIADGGILTLANFIAGADSAMLAKIGPFDAQIRAKLEGDLLPLANLQHLVSLDLFDCRKLHGDLQPLQNLTQLTAINLTRCSRLTGDLRALANLTALTKLDLHGCSGLSGDLKPLENLTKLTSLDLCGCRGCTGRLNGLSSLGFLSFCASQTSILGESLQARAVQIIDCTNADDFGPLDQLGVIDWIRLNCNGLTSIPDLSFLRDRLIGLRIDSNRRLGDITNVKHLTRLKELDLRNSVGLDPAQVAEVQKALPGCKIYV